MSTLPSGLPHTGRDASPVFAAEWWWVYPSLPSSFSPPRNPPSHSSAALLVCCHGHCSPSLISHHSSSFFKGACPKKPSVVCCVCVPQKCRLGDRGMCGAPRKPLSQGAHVRAALNNTQAIIGAVNKINYFPPARKLHK